MGLFGKKNNDETKCKKCNLEFSSPERLERHTEKAHPKSSKLRPRRKHGEPSKPQTERIETYLPDKTILVLRIHTHQACCQNNTAPSDNFFEIQQLVPSQHLLQSFE